MKDNHFPSYTVMATHPHQAGVTRILKSSPTCQSSCLVTRMSTFDAGSSKIEPEADLNGGARGCALSLFFAINCFL